MARISQEELRSTLNTLIDGFKEVLNLYDQTLSRLKNTSDAISSNLKDLNKQSAQGIQNINKALVQTEKLAQEREKTDQQRAKTSEQLSKVQTQYNKTLQEAEKINIQAQKLEQEKEKTAQQRLKTQEAQRKQAERIRKEEEKLNSAYSKASKELNDLRKIQKDLDIQKARGIKLDKEQRQTLRRVSREVNKLDKALKDVDASAGQFQRNVGNYPDSLNKATSSLLKLAAGAAAVKGSLDGVKTSLDATEEGNEDLRVATSKTEAAIQTAKNTLGTFFNDAINTGSEFIDLLTDQEKQTEALRRVNKAAGEDAGFFDKIGAINEVVGDELAEGFEKTGESVGNFAENLQKATEAAGEAEEAQIKLDKQLLKLRQDEAALTTVIETQTAIAGDSTKSFDEIEAAAQKAQVATVARSRIQLEVANAELAITEQLIKSRGEGANTLALQQQRTEQLVRVEEAKKDLDLELLDLSKTINENNRDRFERELDFAIDAFDAVKAVNERRIADERLTLDERNKILQETNQLTDESFQNQIKLVQDFTKQKIDLDALAQESDEEAIRANLDRFNFDDVTLGRILEIIRERKLAVQDLAEAERDLRDAQDTEQRISQNIDLQEQEIELLKQRLDGTIKTAEELEEQREEQNINRLEEEKQLIEDLLEQEKEGSIKFLELQEELNAKELELLEAKIEEKDKLREKDLDNQAKTEELRAELIDKSINTIEDGVNFLFEKSLNNINSQITSTQNTINGLNAAIAAGSASASQSLSLEEDRLRELEREQQRIAESRIKTEAAIALFSAYAESGDIGQTIGAATTIKAAVNNLLPFYHGTDDTGTGTIRDQYGTITGYTHDNERVFNADQTSELNALGFTTRDSLMDLARKSAVDGGSLALVPAQTINIDNEKVVEKLTKVEKTISALIGSIPHYAPDDSGRYIKEVYRKQNEILTKKRNARRQ